jgi:tight adherence protein B
MPALTLLLLGSALLVVPGADPLRRRIIWLATVRIADHPPPTAQAGRDAPPAASRRGTGRPPSARLGTGAVLRTVTGTGWLPSALSAAAVLPLAGRLPAALAGIAALVTVRCARRMQEGRRRAAHRAELVSAVAALADEYTAGATVAGAFAAAAPVAPYYRARLLAAAGAASRGSPPATGLLDDVGADPHGARGELADLGVACEVAREIGAPLGPALAALRRDLDADRATRRAVAAALTGPRASALLLALLPLVGVAMGAALAADPARVLLHTPIGLALLTVGVLLELAGLCWTLAMAERATP